MLLHTEQTLPLQQVLGKTHISGFLLRGLLQDRQTVLVSFPVGQLNRDLIDRNFHRRWLRLLEGEQAIFERYAAEMEIEQSRNVLGGNANRSATV